MTFYYRVILNGKENTLKLGRFPDITITQARNLAKQSAGKVSQGIDIQKAKKLAVQKANNEKKTTLRGYIDHVYKDHLITEKKTGAKILKAINSSFEQWNNKQLTDINTFLVGNWRKGQLKRGLTNASVNRPIAYLRALLNHAYRQAKVIDHHPLETFKQLKEDKSKVVRYLSESEERRLRQALNERDNNARLERETANQWRNDRKYSLLPAIPMNGYSDYLNPMIILAINTGMRRGELFNLKWRDIDFKARTLAIHGITTIQKESAKSGSTRIIPLNDEALGTLIKWQNISESKSYIFTGKNGRLTDIKTPF